jgi:hypothetical protein
MSRNIIFILIYRHKLLGYPLFSREHIVRILHDRIPEMFHFVLAERSNGIPKTYVKTNVWRPSARTLRYPIVIHTRMYIDFRFRNGHGSVCSAFNPHTASIYLVTLNVTYITRKSRFNEIGGMNFTLHAQETFLKWMIHITVSNSHTETPPSLVCPRIIVEHIHNYFQHPVPASSAQMGAMQSHPSPRTGEYRWAEQWPNSKVVTLFVTGISRRAGTRETEVTVDEYY